MDQPILSRLQWDLLNTSQELRKGLINLGMDRGRLLNIIPPDGFPMKYHEIDIITSQAVDLIMTLSYEDYVQKSQ